MRIIIVALLLSVLSGCAATKTDCLAMDLKTRQCVKWGAAP